MDRWKSDVFENNDIADLLKRELSSFKKGGLHMAVNTRTPILPVIVKWLYNIKPKTRWTIKPGIMKIIINKPVIIANKTVDELLKEVQSIYLKSDLP